MTREAKDAQDVCFINRPAAIDVAGVWTCQRFQADELT
jgi:hypothetical protein